jgi:hypothetical protein
MFEKMNELQRMRNISAQKDWGDLNIVQLLSEAGHELSRLAKDYSTQLENQ